MGQMPYSTLGVLRNSPWGMLMLPLVLIVVQRELIGHEERYLELAFGEECLERRRPPAPFGGRPAVLAMPTAPSSTPSGYRRGWVPATSAPKGCRTRARSAPPR